MSTLTSAAELWHRWCELGLLRPQDYDADVLESLEPLVSPTGPVAANTISEQLDACEVSARDLIRAVTPLITSFAGMMRDLLALYARVGAAQATGENLRIDYEFEDGHVIDDSLAAFREQVVSVQTAASMLPQLVFDGLRAWDPSWQPFPHIESDLTRTVDELVDRVVWLEEDALPPPATTGRADVDDVVATWWHLITECRRVIATIADDHRQMLEWLYANREVDVETHVQLAQAATDFWPATQLKAVHGLAEATRLGTPPSPEELAALSEWVDGFWMEFPSDVAAEALTGVLSLPLWGRRHELYAAWVLTQIDAALPGRLRIDVVDGAIRFPFRPTRIASLDVAGARGDSTRVELWSEFRSPANDIAGFGRKKAVQPDYQFRDADAGSDGTVLAIEVKQYLRSALRNPGLALRDYALALPSAAVVLVAHGPLSARVTTLTPADAADRVAAIPHVRPTVSSRCAEFRSAVARHLPAPPPPPPPAPSDEGHPPVVPPPLLGRAGSVEFTLRWSATVWDLDVHAHRSGTEQRVSYRNHRESWGQLHADAFAGGPECITLHPTDGVIHLTVRVHAGADSVSHAKAVVTVTTTAGTVYLRPRRGIGREWHVGDLTPEGAFVPGVETAAEG